MAGKESLRTCKVCDMCLHVCMVKVLMLRQIDSDSLLLEVVRFIFTEGHICSFSSVYKGLLDESWNMCSSWLTTMAMKERVRTIRIMHWKWWKNSHHNMKKSSQLLVKMSRELFSSILAAAWLGWGRAGEYINYLVTYRHTEPDILQWKCWEV